MIDVRDAFLDAGPVADLKPGRMKTVAAGEGKIVVVHTSEGIFALDNTCPHRGGPLVEGDIIGNEVVCPWHLWGFDAATGRCAGNPDIAVATHEVRIEGERILVKVKQ